MHLRLRQRSTRAIAVGVALSLMGLVAGQNRVAAATTTQRPSHYDHVATQHGLTDGGTHTGQLSPALATGSQSQAITPDTTNSPELVSDGNFDGNSAPWHQASAGNFPLITNFWANSQPNSADECGYPNCSDNMIQYVSVPRNLTSATLTWNVAAGCPPTSVTCSHTNNAFDIGVIDSNNQASYAQYHLDSAPNQLYNYQSGGISITTYMQQHVGQVISVFLRSGSINNDDAEFFADDLSLTVNEAPDAPTSVSAVSMAAGQATVSWTAPAFEGTSSVTSYTINTYNAHRQFLTSTTSPSSPATVSATNGVPSYFTVSATNSSASGAAAPSNSVTPDAGTTPAAAMAASSASQYFLPNSDGTTWQDMDPSSLAFSITPVADEDVLLSANADLWTFNAGYNQDIAIYVKPSTGSGAVAAWKESGGYAGTFSPNAAFVETVYHMTASVTYTVKVQWKANKKAINATVAAAAGPINSAYSPTRLVARVLPATDSSSAVSTQQYFLSGSNGSTWAPIDATNLSTTITPVADEDVLISGNADMWTFNAGVNQDIGITVTPSGGLAALAAWKESGGNAGTFSPNAAFVQTVFHLAGGTTYTVQLVWKANKSTTGKIAIGAGPINSAYSPTRLTAFPLSVDTTTWGTGFITTQQSLTNSDGATWQSLGGNPLTVTLTPAADEDTIVSANADLWTAYAGYNQDIGIFVSDNSGAPTLVTWKESGGYGGTYSPNAAFVQGVFHMVAGHTYVFSVMWKANKSANPTSKIFAGAGPINAQYSPTRLSVIPAA